MLSMVDAIDEYDVGHPKEFKGNKLVYNTGEGLYFYACKYKKTREKELNKGVEVLYRVTKDVLGDKVEKVVLCHHVFDSPYCLVIGEHGWVANMDRDHEAISL